MSMRRRSANCRSAAGTVLNSARRAALAQAELRDSDDRLLARATSGCMPFPLPAR
ncbi:hypothetical protein [Streptomyces sp. NBC_00842]|uniref:hypothetical protein n=1 Tax=Streptomyces sp. NBC_00842 TaxID=2975848 RepID=UPI00386FD856